MSKDKTKKKVLGGTKYAGSKKKSKNIKPVKNKIITDKNRQLKLKIKNLQKELARIEKTDIADKKISEEKEMLNQKLSKLLNLLEQYRPK